jgi:NAD-dependent deacetylase
MIDGSQLQRAAALLGRVTNLVAFTGAGVSAESGVPTFRGAEGVWKDFRAEEVATPEAFRRDPKLVWEFYNHRRNRLAEVQPNPAHRVLADFERRFPRFTLVTQNIDGLHALAGSRNVLELHGNLGRVRCTGCGRVFDKRGERLGELPACEACGALLRPDVVWFGELLPQDVWSASLAAVEECEAILVVGTSAVVYPAAGLVEVASRRGATIVVVNLEPTAASELADVSLHGKAGEVLPALWEELKLIATP